MSLSYNLTVFFYPLNEKEILKEILCSCSYKVFHNSFSKKIYVDINKEDSAQIEEEELIKALMETIAFASFLYDYPTPNENPEVCK